MFEKRQEPNLIKLIAGTLIGIWLAMVLGYGILNAFELNLPIRILLFVPDRLGLLREPGPEDILVFDAPGDFIVRDIKAGRYQIYSEPRYPYSTIDIYKLETGRPVFIHRWILLKPISVEIEQPGDYSFRVDTRGGPVHFVRDYTESNNRVIYITLLIQFLVILAIMRVDILKVAYLWRCNERERKAKRSAEHASRSAEFDEWLDDVKKNRGL